MVGKLLPGVVGPLAEGLEQALGLQLQLIEGDVAGNGW
jgi:hypothetical protein